MDALLAFLIHFIVLTIVAVLVFSLAAVWAFICQETIKGATRLWRVLFP